MRGAASAPVAPNGAEPFPGAASEPQPSGCSHLAGHPAPLGAPGLPELLLPRLAVAVHDLFVSPLTPSRVFPPQRRSSVQSPL